MDGWEKATLNASPFKCVLGIVISAHCYNDVYILF